MAFLIVLTWVIGTAVFGPGRVTSHRIQGAVAIYLQTDLILAPCYVIILTVVPNAFSLPALPSPLSNLRQLLYFSVVTLMSTGYGDTAPVLLLARSLASVEAIVSQPFPATLSAARAQPSSGL
jgi:hypothetical protein